MNIKPELRRDVYRWATISIVFRIIATVVFVLISSRSIDSGYITTQFLLTGRLLFPLSIIEGMASQIVYPVVSAIYTIVYTYVLSLPGEQHLPHVIRIIIEVCLALMSGALIGVWWNYIHTSTAKWFVCMKGAFEGMLTGIVLSTMIYIVMMLLPTNEHLGISYLLFFIGASITPILMLIFGLIRLFSVKRH